MVRTFFLFYVKVYKMKLYGARYVWIVTGSWSKDWWLKPGNHNCTVEQIIDVSSHYINLLPGNLDNLEMQLTVAGQVSSERASKLQ